MGRGAHRAVLRTGDRVRLDGVVRTVTAIVGTVVRLTDEQGRTGEVSLVEVFTRGVVEEPGPGPANRLAHGVLAGPHQARSGLPACLARTRSPPPAPPVPGRARPPAWSPTVPSA